MSAIKRTVSKPYRAMSSHQKRFKTVRVKKLNETSSTSQRLPIAVPLTDTYTENNCEDPLFDDALSDIVQAPSSNWDDRVRQRKEFWDIASPLLLESYLKRKDKWSLCSECECTFKLPGCGQIDDCDCNIYEFESVTCILSLRGKHDNNADK